MEHTTNNYTDLEKSIQLLLDEIKEMHEIIEVAQRGLAVTQAMPQAVVALSKATGREESDEHKESLERIQRFAGIAKGEIDSGFLFLYSLSVVMLYSYLEAAIKRFVITYFKNNNIENIKELSNIKITFSEFLNLNENERFEYLFVQYEKQYTVGMQYGVTRFESLLNPIDFGGKVRSEVSKSIFELSQIRNNILHRGGIVDKQLNINCPWLNYSIGEKLKVSSETYDKYFSAVCKYAMLITVRLGEKRGNDMSEYKDDA